MSDAEQNLDVVEVDYKAMYEKIAADFEKVAAKKEELYKETKKAKAEREHAEIEAKRILEETAKKNGEFEKLWQTASKEKEELLNQLKAVKHANRQEKLQVVSMKIANELADGDNAELLSEFVVRSLDNMADESGLLSNDVMKAVVDDFKNNAKFKSLLRASKASGGSAPGISKSVVEKTTITRNEFDGLVGSKKADAIADLRSGKLQLID